MDCKTARLLLAFARPCATELDAAGVQALEAHLADCHECGPLARLENRLDEHLGQAVRDVPLPPGLRTRLLAGLRPDPWHQRRWVRAAAGLAAAAALVLSVTLGWITHTKPVVLDLEQVSQDMF